MVIAIDGPGGVGKSTVSLGVANRLGLAHLDTGATYRAATVAVLDAGVSATDEDAIRRELKNHVIGYGRDGVTLDDRLIAREVRSEEVTSTVSAVSAHPGVRAAIVAMQRAWVETRSGSAVVEGRDIGTVVFPDASVKVYLTARPEVRAARRAGDNDGSTLPVAEVAAALAARDSADSTRKASPLRPADDAVVIDTSDIGIEAVIDAIVALTLDRDTA